MASFVIDNFYLSEDQLQASPSRRDGVDGETELALRLYGCEVIQEAVVLLRLPQVVAATAQVLLHRFICKRSLKSFHIKKSAFASVWLACKLEEQIHSNQLNKINVVFERIYARREGLPLTVPDPAIDNAVQWNTEINTRYELEMLKSFGFICHVDHPHKLICNLIGFIFMDRSDRLDESVSSAPSELTQEAWNLANDSLRTTLCVRLRPEVVACGCIFLASRRLGIALPESPPWWTLFGVEFSDIDTVCREILLLYTRPKARYISVNRDASKAAADGKKEVKSEERARADAADAAAAEPSAPAAAAAAEPPEQETANGAVAEAPPGFSQGTTVQGGRKRGHDADERERGHDGGRARDRKGREARDARDGDSRGYDRDNRRPPRGDFRQRSRDARDGGQPDRGNRDRGDRDRGEPRGGDREERSRGYRSSPEDRDAKRRRGDGANQSREPRPDEKAAKSSRSARGDGDAARDAGGKRGNAGGNQAGGALPPPPSPRVAPDVGKPTDRPKRHDRTIHFPS